MAGAGRKGAYRKSVLEDVLNNYPVPDLSKGETLARVVAPRGGNLMEVLCADGAEGLAMLPTKFRKLIWVKRGDMVIVSGASGDIETHEGASAAVKYMVIHVLYEDQIKHIKKEGLWPERFDTSTSTRASAAAAEAAEEEAVSGGAVAEDAAATTADAVAQMSLRDGAAKQKKGVSAGGAEEGGARTFFDDEPGPGTDAGTEASTAASAAEGTGAAAAEEEEAPKGLDKFGNGVEVPDEDVGEYEEETDEELDELFVNNNRRNMVRKESSDEESDED